MIRTPPSFNNVLLSNNSGNNQWDPEIEKIANEMGIPPDLLKAQMLRESSGDPNASGDNGKSNGLMQIQEATWEDFRAKNRDKLPPELRDASYNDIKNNPELNLKAGAALMKSYHDEWMAKGYSSDEAWKLALRQYNTGSVPDPNDLSNAGGATPDYVDTVWSEYLKAPGYKPNVLMASLYDDNDIN